MWLSEPVFKTIASKQIIGMKLQTTLHANETAALWKKFMQNKGRIIHRANRDIISMHLYNPHLNFFDFNEHTPFEKWAAAEVTNPVSIPEGMETMVIPGGLYAVFQFRGSDNPFPFIFQNWLPASGYELENRPHFETMGIDYQEKDPNAFEELHIPVKRKN